MGSEADSAARRDRNLAAVRSMLAAISAGDPAGYLSHVADDVVYEAPYYAKLMFVRFRDGRVAHWREFSNPDVYRRATGG